MFTRNKKHSLLNLDAYPARGGKIFGCGSEVSLVICSALINMCTWHPLSLFLRPPALSLLHLRAVHPRLKEPSSTASADTWNSSPPSFLCVVFFAREKMGVFAQGKTLFSSFCCLWSPPVVYMVKISGTYNPATVRSQSHVWPGQTHTRWRVMARLLSQGWQVSTIMFSFSLTLFFFFSFFFSPCLSSKQQFFKKTTLVTMRTI